MFHERILELVPRVLAYHSERLLNQTVSTLFQVEGLNSSFDYPNHNRQVNFELDNTAHWMSIIMLTNKRCTPDTRQQLTVLSPCLPQGQIPE